MARKKLMTLEERREKMARKKVTLEERTVKMKMKRRKADKEDREWWRTMNRCLQDMKDRLDATEKYLDGRAVLHLKLKPFLNVLAGKVLLWAARYDPHGPLLSRCESSGQELSDFASFFQSSNSQGFKTLATELDLTEPELLHTIDRAYKVRDSLVHFDHNTPLEDTVRGARLAIIDSLDVKLKEVADQIRIIEGFEGFRKFRK